MLNQLFSNLLSNSIRFQVPGRALKITVSHSVKKINQKEYDEIRFTDNGRGFENQYAQNIFKVFYRLQSNQEIEGTGVGLAICKKVMEMHNGHIYATGIPNEGATFYMQFPKN